MHAIYINAGVESPKCVRLDKTTLALLFDKAWGTKFLHGGSLTERYEKQERLKVERHRNYKLKGDTVRNRDVGTTRIAQIVGLIELQTNKHMTARL